MVLTSPPPAPLVSTAWVEQHREDRHLVLVEVDEDGGTYYDGHIPGAHNLDWLDDLAHPTRRAFVDQAGYESLMDRLGIAEDDHVVLYGDASNVFAANAYWIFRYYGHQRLSLMDGGGQSWHSEGRPTSQEVPTPRPRAGYRVRETRPDIHATRDQVLQRFVGAPPGTAVIDCRSAAEFAGGIGDPLDLPLGRHRVPGRIPGARNFDASGVLDPVTGRLLPEPVLAGLYRDHGVQEHTEVVVYCRLAAYSALHWFVLREVLQHPNVRLYAGGWAEYGSLADVPVERDHLPEDGWPHQKDALLEP